MDSPRRIGWEQVPNVRRIRAIFIVVISGGCLGLAAPGIILASKGIPWGLCLLAAPVVIATLGVFGLLYEFGPRKTTSMALRWYRFQDDARHHSWVLWTLAAVILAVGVIAQTYFPDPGFHGLILALAFAAASSGLAVLFYPRPRRKSVAKPANRID